MRARIPITFIVFSLTRLIINFCIALKLSFITEITTLLNLIAGIPA